MTRLSSISFDKNERPRRACIITPLGTIKVEWRDVCGNRSWFTTGNLNAKHLAVPVIQRIERQFPGAHNPPKHHDR
jgi:hypothetical protein